MAYLAIKNGKILETSNNYIELENYYRDVPGITIRNGLTGVTWTIEPFEDYDPELCNSCSGSGEGQYDDTVCHTCKGKGER